MGIGAVLNPASGQGTTKIKGQSIQEFLSTGGRAAWKAKQSGGVHANFDPADDEDGPISDKDLFFQPSPFDGNTGGDGGSGNGSNAGGFRNTFVNDPCLDPPPPNFARTVQSETEIAVYNPAGNGRDGDDDSNSADNSDYGRNHGGRLMVAGYNDSYGFYNNRQGLSGFAYSTDGGKLWIDASGLPPMVPSGAPAGTLGSDAYFGDPWLVVDNSPRTFRVGNQRISQSGGVFYYASLYQTVAGLATISVNRGQFRVAPQQVPVESKANSRCENNPAAFGVPDPPPFVQERIIWEAPVVAVPPPFLGQNNDAFLDKESLYVDQETGFLYLTYVRIAADGATPIEMVRSFDGGRTWTPPTIIVPNLDDTFNTATMPVVTPTGRVIVTWHARTFPSPAFVEREQRIEVAFSDDGGNTFGPPVIVTTVNPQAEPPGYNRGRTMILNVPYINVDRGRDDGRTTEGERQQKGFGNVYITYFSGLTAFAQAPAPPTRTFARVADIYLSTSTTDGTTWRPRQKVNDDNTQTSHVFPSVQVNDKNEVFVTWLDRRLDPRNLLTDTWGEISEGKRLSTGTTTGAGDFRITDVSTDWVARADARPNFGDYNSSEVIDYRDFVSIWSDGRFPTPVPLTQTPTGGYTRPASGAATPDVLMAIVGRGARKGPVDQDH
jgi:hypothetical protein